VSDPVRVLQHEADRTVLLEADGTTIRKVFHSDARSTSIELAAREFSILERFNAALADEEHLTCPRPLQLGQGDEVYIRMERAAGSPMQDHLNLGLLPIAEAQLAALLSHGLFRYVDTFGEPYWDFIFRNMFFAADPGVVTFLDFGFPDLYLPRLDELRRRTPMEVSLAALVASAIFDAGRPTRMTRRREHARAFRIATLTLHHAVSDPASPEVSIDAVCACATALYALATGGGRRVRREWYLRIGALLARPTAKLGQLSA